MTITLADIEAVIANSGAGEAIEALLPDAVRGRQLHAGTLLADKMLALADGRPAHLTRAHDALLALPEHDQKRPGVIEDWKDGAHQLTYRQVEHTNRLVKTALAKPAPDGAPPAVLLRLCTQLTEASIPEPFKDANSSLAADWTDAESWSRPVPADRPGTGTDPEARWGHRTVARSIQEGEMFFGYYLSAAVMVADENGEPVPEFARRITVGSSSHDPAPRWQQSWQTWPRPPTSRSATSWPTPATPTASRKPGQNRCAPPERSWGAGPAPQRGPQGTHQGAIIANGNL